MKDIHSHLLPGIDDGSQTLTESIKLIKDLVKEGTTSLILTPHYIENSNYMCNNKDKKKLLEKLKKELENEKISIDLYLGNEVFFTPNILTLLNNEEINTLENSKYLLIEFPMSRIYNNTSHILSELISKGYIPVLAHPERYYVFQRHPEEIERYLKMGVILQGNASSIFGEYGRITKKTFKLFLKKKYYTFLGSDTHRKVKYKEKKLKKKLISITKDEQYALDILENNFEKIINNEDISVYR